LGALRHVGAVTTRGEKLAQAAKVFRIRADATNSKKYTKAYGADLMKYGLRFGE